MDIKMINLLKIRFTIISYMIIIAVISIFYQKLLIPEININKEHNTYLMAGVVEMVSPFWPQYWRRIRNIPEPLEPEEILRSDDGGLMLMAVIALPVALGLAYKFRKYLVR
jgi:hypothetical protein